MPQPKKPVEYDEQTVRAKAEEQWRRDPALRAEFGGDLEAYVAYERATARGWTKVLGNE